MSKSATLVDIARGHAESRPSKPFVIMWGAEGSRETSYSQLWARACAVAALLRSAGVNKGDPVVLVHEPSPDLFAGFLGAMILGAAPTIMPYPNARQRDEIYWSSHRALYGHIEPAAYLLSARMADIYRSCMPEMASRFVTIETLPQVPADLEPELLQPDQIAFLQHSSGTTALKKGVLLTHAAVVTHVNRYAEAIGLTADSEIVSWLPLYHDMGLIACFMTPLVIGATVTIIDNFEWVARPRMLLDAIGARRGEFVWMPNFGFMHLVNAVRNPQDFDLTSIRAFINCSEPCRPSTHERFVAHFALSGVRPEAVQVCYAMAENVFAVSQTSIGCGAGKLAVERSAFEGGRIVPLAAPAASVELASCGRLLPGTQIRIEGPTGEPLPEGRIGEIVIRSETLFSRYNRRPDLTDRALVDGWYQTNDLGFMHDEELYVTGRRDDVILAYGRNLMAHELEATVSEIEGVRPGRAVVFGVESEQSGTSELVVLYEATDGSDPAHVSKAIRSRLEAAAGVAPRYVELVAPGRLIKTTSGKISRSGNRDMFLGRSPAAGETIALVEGTGEV